MSPQNEINPDDFIRIEKNKGIATIWIDRKGEKQNIVSPSLIGLFDSTFKQLDEDQEVKAVVLISGKKDFIAGADIAAFKAEKVGDFQPVSRKGHEILQRLENSKKPIVSAIHGTCYGLGVEMSLACTARICSDHKSTKLALPEVKLGLLPGGGGTQRLPRLIGIQKALDMMLTGKNIYAYPAKKMGLVDDVVNKNKLHSAAVQMAARLIKTPIVRKRKKTMMQRLLDDTAIGRGIVFSQARKMVQKMTQGNYPAAFEIINCAEIGLKQGLKAGYEAEVIRFEKLMLTPQSRGLISLFHAMAAKKKNPYPDLVKETRTLAVLGGGLMGGGIADVSIASGMNVLLKDIKEEMITEARIHIWKSLKKKLSRRVITNIEAGEIMNRLRGQLDYSDFDKTDLVIEAIPEILSLKQKILAEVEEAGHDKIIFATNTSALPVKNIGANAKRPENVIGMHYFSPVDKMPLLEIIRTEKTADWVVASCYEAGVRQGKTVIVVKDTPGFYTNRILAPYLNEAMLVIEEGEKLGNVDRLMKKRGFPVGPFQLMDEVGIDVGAHVMSGDLNEVVKDREGLVISQGLPKLFKAGYHGRKNKKGFFLYDPKTGRRKGENAAIYPFFGGKARTEMDGTEIQNRCLMMMVNEAVLCLEEEIVNNPLDGDVGAVFGLGFLPFTGGPFRLIDEMGASEVLKVMKDLEAKHGARFKAAKTIVDFARSGSKFYA